MRFLLGLGIIFIAGCVTKQEPVTPSYNNHYSGFRTYRDYEIAEQNKREEASRPILQKFAEHQRFLFEMTYIESESSVTGQIKEINPEFRFTIEDNTFWFAPDDNLVVKVKKDQAIEILHNLQDSGCSFYIELRKDQNELVATYDKYRDEYTLKGEIQVEYKGQTKSLKEIYIKKKVLDDVINDIFDEPKGEIFP